MTSECDMKTGDVCIR